MNIKSLINEHDTFREMENDEGQVTGGKHCLYIELRSIQKRNSEGNSIEEYHQKFSKYQYLFRINKLIK